MMAQVAERRIGIDLGGTKIAGIALDRHDNTIAERRIPTPRNDYPATLSVIATLVDQLTGSDQKDLSIGIGIPGSLVPGRDTVQNANSTWLNNRRFQHDLEETLKQPVRCANDANCFALSEAYDGAAKDLASVFGVILGTGCGGSLIANNHIINGPRNIGGEWGHNPLPWPDLSEIPGPQCWCGSNGCMETWVSGPAISHDHARVTGHQLATEEIVAQARVGNEPARDTLERHVSRLARGLAHVVNMFDPAVIVLGGGLSSLPHLYQQLPERISPYIFATDTSVDIRPPKWGDASGVRGAARLWQQ